MLPSVTPGSGCWPWTGLTLCRRTSGSAWRSEPPLLGDVDNSDPRQWKEPFAGGEQRVHTLVIIAADTPEDLDAAYQRLRRIMASSGVIELDDHQNDDVRADTARGHEYFGFKDGISQPGITGVTESSKHPPDQLAAGEFLVGYPDEDGHVSGHPGVGVRPHMSHQVRPDV